MCGSARSLTYFRTFLNGPTVLSLSLFGHSIIESCSIKCCYVQMRTLLRNVASHDHCVDCSLPFDSHVDQWTGLWRVQWSHAGEFVSNDTLCVITVRNPSLRLTLARFLHPGVIALVYTDTPFPFESVSCSPLPGLPNSTCHMV